jgi:hypothetical protein
MTERDRAGQHAPFPDYALHPVDIQELADTVQLCTECQDPMPVASVGTICVNCREDAEEREERSRLGMWPALLVLLCAGCVAQFRNATSADEAQCRNVMRAIGGGIVVQIETYNDCMRGKGYTEEDQ